MNDLVDIQKAFVKGPVLARNSARRVGSNAFEETWQTHRTPGIVGRARGERQMVGGLGTFTTGRNARVYEVERGMKQNLAASKRLRRSAPVTRNVAAPAPNAGVPEWLR